ncbi:MAG: hypothetical protein CM15mP47_1720 [Methanobacteriota archaeon]|nr:MAG: hypothetical protein CM15mP47_1720 [Euryarchaeota archaeon]
MMTIEEVGELVDANCHKMANTFMSDSLRLRYIELLLEDNMKAKNEIRSLTSPRNFLGQTPLSDIQQDGGYFTQKSIKTR